MSDDWSEIAREFGISEFQGSWQWTPDSVKRMAEEIVRLRQKLDNSDSIGNALMKSESSLMKSLEDEIVYSEKLREALQNIKYSGLSQGWAGDSRDASTALDDANQIASEALELKRPGEEE